MKEYLPRVIVLDHSVDYKYYVFLSTFTCCQSTDESNGQAGMLSLVGEWGYYLY